MAQPTYDIADCWNNRVRLSGSKSGALTTIAGTGVEGFSGDSGPATAAQLFCPRRRCGDANGRVYIADTGNSRTA